MSSAQAQETQPQETPVEPLQSCMEYGKLKTLLLERHQESGIAFGLSASGRLLQIFSKEDGSTWTMVFIDPSGTSCVMAVGDDWITIEKQEPDL